MLRLVNSGNVERLAFLRVELELPEAAPVFECVESALQHLVSEKVAIGWYRPDGRIVCEEPDSNPFGAACRNAKVVCIQDVENG